MIGNLIVKAVGFDYLEVVFHSYICNYRYMFFTFSPGGGGEVLLISSDWRSFLGLKLSIQWFFGVFTTIWRLVVVSAYFGRIVLQIKYDPFWVFLRLGGLAWEFFNIIVCPGMVSGFVGSPRVFVFFLVFIFAPIWSTPHWKFRVPHWEDKPKLRATWNCLSFMSPL